MDTFLMEFQFLGILLDFTTSGTGELLRTLLIWSVSSFEILIIICMIITSETVDTEFMNRIREKKKGKIRNFSCYLLTLVKPQMNSTNNV